MKKKTVKEKILELKKKGYSYSQIQKEVGCSKGTIAYHLGIGQKDKTINRTKGYRTKIKDYIQEYKAGKVCIDCGENYPYWILEFDHLGDDKNFTIAQFREVTNSLEIIKEEIKKCEVVCANCHRNRTFQRQTKNARHVNLDICDYPE
jgi:thymidine kinase